MGGLRLCQVVGQPRPRREGLPDRGGRGCSEEGGAARPRREGLLGSRDRSRPVPYGNPCESKRTRRGGPACPPAFSFLPVIPVSIKAEERGAAADEQHTGSQFLVLRSELTPHAILPLEQTSPALLHEGRHWYTSPSRGKTAGFSLSASCSRFFRSSGSRISSPCSTRISVAPSRSHTAISASPTPSPPYRAPCA